MRLNTDDSEAYAPTPSRPLSIARAGVSYLLFAVALGALYSFFAPFVGLPGVVVYDALPEIAAQTEGQAVVDAGPLVVGVVLAAVAVWLR